MLSRKLIGTAVVALWLALVGRAGAQFAEGQFLSYGQADWGDTPTPTNAAGLLQANYNSVYASTFGLLEIGIVGASGFSISFLDASNVLNYLPASGASGPLTSDFSNPNNTTAGEFGGHVTALRVNVDFSDAGLLLGSTGIPYGDVVLHSFNAQPLLNGITIRQFLGQVETLLGGGSASYPFAELAPIAANLTVAFGFGVVSPFANDHLRIGPYFAAGDFITHTQLDWGASPLAGNAAELLSDNYSAAYDSTGGLFTLGRFGPIHFAMQFDSATALGNYLPATGPDMRLNADHLNPTTTNAGGFGGEVAALKLNIDFADAGLTLGNSSLAFGDLELHDLADISQTQFNDLSVRDFFASASFTLGTNGVGHDVTNYNAIAEQLNASFASDSISLWARSHLRIPGLPGDFDQDDDVDGLDFLKWQRGETTHAHTVADLALWQTNFGTAQAGTTSALVSVVPEPTGLLLAVCLGLAVALRRGRGLRRHDCT